MEYFVLAYYYFTQIENPPLEVANHKRFFKGREATSRIYISEEGINGQMSASESDAIAYMEWLRSDPRFKEVKFKVHHYHEQAFPRLTIKVRKELVAVGIKVDVQKDGGKHISPKQWGEMIEKKDPNTILIDVRNDYEWKIGHFEGALLPEINTFREFPQYAKDLKNDYDPSKTKVMMCCTGGIRCEVYSAIVKQAGFEEVYQLDGGIIQYGLEEGSKHWKGKLFVFDDRMAVPLSEDSQPITECSFCHAPCDIYFNCANMDCNDLFIACEKCALEAHGCCSGHCYETGRVRAFEGDPKPYRRLHKAQKDQFVSS